MARADRAAQGLELVGGRPLPDATGPSAQLMCQQVVPVGASGAEPPKPVRVTVYLRKPDRDTLAAFRREQRGALGMFYRVEGATAQGGPCGNVNGGWRWPSRSRGRATL